MSEPNPMPPTEADLNADAELAYNDGLKAIALSASRLTATRAVQYANALLLCPQRAKDNTLCPSCEKIDRAWEDASK